MILDELKKSVINKNMLAAILIGMAALLAGGYEPLFLYEDVDFSYTFIFGFSAGTSSIMALIFPILACMPYASSYIQELQSGYINYKFIKTKKWKYIISKLVSGSISGGLAVGIPTLIYFFFCIALKGTALADGGSPYFTHGISLYHQSPVWYCFLYVINAFFCGGVFSILGLAFSIFIKKPYLVSFLPFLAYILGNIIFSGICTQFNPTLLIDSNLYQDSSIFITNILKAGLVLSGTAVFWIGVYKNET